MLKERLRTLVGTSQNPLATSALTFADTEGTFRPERIMEIAERFGGKSFFHASGYIHTDGGS